MSETSKASWQQGLARKGLYYEGVVDNIEDTLELHRGSTVSTFGTRRSCQPGRSRSATDSEGNVSR